MKRFLCVISDPQIFGRGHLARQVELQNEFMRHGFEYQIQINTLDIKNLTMPQNHTIVLDLSIHDSEPPTSYLNQFSQSIGFDWSGEFIPDLNLVVVKHPERQYRAKIATEYGLQNLIINRNLPAARLSQESPSKEFLLISLGYSARGESYLRALAEIQNLPSMQIIVATGIDLDLDLPSNCQVVIDSPNFVELMANSKAVISNGGTTYVEALLLGKPVLAMPQNSEEQYFVETLSNLTIKDSSNSGFRSLDFRKALEAGMDTNGAERLCNQMLGVR